MAAKKRAENRAVSAPGLGSGGDGVVPAAPSARGRPKGTRQRVGLLATILLDSYDAIWVHTELKRARIELEREVERRTASLREQEERLRAILNAPDDAIITIRQNGIIESVNPAAERMFGYSSDAMIGQNVKMLMPAPYRREHDQYLARYLRTGEKRSLSMKKSAISQSAARVLIVDDHPAVREALSIRRPRTCMPAFRRRGRKTFISAPA